MRNDDLFWCFGAPPSPSEVPCVYTQSKAKNTHVLVFPFPPLQAESASLPHPILFLFFLLNRFRLSSLKNRERRKRRYPIPLPVPPSKVKHPIVFHFIPSHFFASKQGQWQKDSQAKNQTPYLRSPFRPQKSGTPLLPPYPSNFHVCRPIHRAGGHLLSVPPWMGDTKGGGRRERPPRPSRSAVAVVDGRPRG